MSSASELPPEQHASYSAIIDQILASSDLNTISAKRIRNGLQDKVAYDITPQKAAITDLIMLRFDKFQRDQDDPSAASEPAPTTNGATKVEPKASGSASPPKRKVKDADDDDEEDSMSDVADSPPQKKAKKSAKAIKAETDEELAKRMQAELNAPQRATRGGGVTKRKSAAKVKKGTQKTPSSKKKKSKAKINSDDDSEVEGSDGEKPEKEKKGGFHKSMHLSAPLADLVGYPALSRPQTVKKIWAYVKEHDLQDPSDKRQIRCDDAMWAVFKQERVHMFTMNKLLASHLHAVDETA